MKYILTELHNNEIERNIIACCFQNNSLIDEIEVEWFYSSSSKEIVKGFKELRNKGKNIDLIVFSEYLVNKKMPVPLAEVTDIHNSFLTLANINEHIEILKELFNKRTIYLAVNKLDYSMESNNMIDKMSKLCETLYSNNENKESTKEYLFSYIDNLYKKNIESSIKTGFRNIDNDILGFLSGQLITISAYTGIGKSILTSQLILNMLKQNKKIDLFSLEMGRGEIINKLVSMDVILNLIKFIKMS